MAEPTIDQEEMAAPASDHPVRDATPAPASDAPDPATATAPASDAPAGDAVAAPAEAATTIRLQLTPSALEEIGEMLAEAGVEEEGGLRLTARTGAGCSAPLQYGMFLEEAPEAGDVVVTAGDVRIFLSPQDAWSLDGLLVDYVSSPHLGEGFAFRHPNGPHGRSC